MNESIKDIKLPVFGKLFKWIVPIALIWGSIKLFNKVAPTLEDFVGHLYFLGITIGLPVLIFSIYLMNRTTIDMWWLGKCKSVSNFFKSMDPISIMRGYLIKLLKKIKNMEKVILFIEGKKNYLGTLIDTKKSEVITYEKQAIAAKQQGEETAAILNMKKANGCKESISLFTPLYEKYDKTSIYLRKLLENWKESAESTRFTIENKTEQFETIKSMYKGLKSIDDLTRSDSPEVQIFVESMKALEQDMSQRQAFLDDFERRSQPILTDMKVKKQAETNDALAALEELMKNTNLKLPNYQTFVPVLNKSNTVDAEYELLPNKYSI